MNTCIYISKLNFDKRNIKLLKKNYNVLKLNKIEDCPSIKKNKIKIIIVPMDKFYGEKILKKFPYLKIVASPTTGDVHIDKKYIKKRKIKFINLKKNTRLMKKITATSDLVFAFIFDLTRNILKNFHHFFNKKVNFDNKYIAQYSIKNLSIGIVGLGRIGKHVAIGSKSLGMKVHYFDPNINDKRLIKEKKLENLFKKCNIVTLHLHFEKNLKNFINEKLFKIQKKPSYFINTSRGEFVNEISLINSLKKNILSGAALDVIKNSFKFPKKIKNNKLLKFYQDNPDANLIITPKIGGSTTEARIMTENYIINTIKKYKIH